MKKVVARTRSQAGRPLVGSMVAIGTVVIGSAAWACVPQARLVSIAPKSSGAAGTVVTVNGLAFDPGPAEVRWNASDGPRLATASGPDFSVPVTIPTAETGLYSIVVLSRAPDGSVGNAASTAFQVTGSGPSGGDVSGRTAQPSPGAARSSGPPGVVLVSAGGALLVGGALLGAGLYRRRRPAG